MILARWPERPRGAPDASIFCHARLGLGEKQRENKKKGSNGQGMRGGSKIDFERQTVSPEKVLLERPSKFKRPNLQGDASGAMPLVIAEPSAHFLSCALFLL